MYYMDTLIVPETPIIRQINSIHNNVNAFGMRSNRYETSLIYNLNCDLSLT